MTSNELEIFKQSILDEVRVMMQTTGQVTQYIGARYVPLFAEPFDWDINKEYEPLTIVTHQGNSFTSRQFVPKGIELTNEQFWAETGNYNAQIEQYRQEVATFDGRIANVESTVETKAPINHASESTEYGIGNAMNYGHVKLADNIMDSNSNEGVAATPLMVENSIKGGMLGLAIYGTANMPENHNVQSACLNNGKLIVTGCNAENKSAFYSTVDFKNDTQSYVTKKYSVNSHQNSICVNPKNGNYIISGIVGDTPTIEVNQNFDFVRGYNTIPYAGIDTIDGDTWYAIREDHVKTYIDELNSSFEVQKTTTIETTFGVLQNIKLIDETHLLIISSNQIVYYDIPANSVISTWYSPFFDYEIEGFAYDGEHCFVVGNCSISNGYIVFSCSLLNKVGIVEHYTDFQGTFQNGTITYNKGTNFFAKGSNPIVHTTAIPLNIFKCIRSIKIEDDLVIYHEPYIPPIIDAIKPATLTIGPNFTKTLYISGTGGPVTVNANNNGFFEIGVNTTLNVSSGFGYIVDIVAKSAKITSRGEADIIVNGSSQRVKECLSLFNTSVTVNEKSTALLDKGTNISLLKNNTFLAEVSATKGGDSIGIICRTSALHAFSLYGVGCDRNGNLITVVISYNNSENNFLVQNCKINSNNAYVNNIYPI